MNDISAWACGVEEDDDQVFDGGGVVALRTDLDAAGVEIALDFELISQAEMEMSAAVVDDVLFDDGAESGPAVLG